MRSERWMVYYVPILGREADELLFEELSVEQSPLSSETIDRSERVDVVDEHGNRRILKDRAPGGPK